MENPIPWWATQVVLALIAIFFILFGINLLYMAYQITEPFSFIMTFFASNLIILISVTLLFGFVLKIVTTLKKSKPQIFDHCRTRWNFL
jgi:nitrogen fixation/metabolism regulation signal transduction histidine kinase